MSDAKRHLRPGPTHGQSVLGELEIFVSGGGVLLGCSTTGDGYHTKLMRLLAAMLLFGASAEGFADTVTYDFTGVASEVQNEEVAGTPVTGSFSIDFAAAYPQDSFQTVGNMNAPWSAANEGGTFYGTPVPNAFVFTETLTAGNYSYTSTPGAYSTNSSVGSTLDQYQTWVAEFNSCPTANSCTEAGIDLRGSNFTFDSNGLPILANADLGQSNEINGPNGQVLYTINTLTPVPLPAAVWLLLSGLGGLGGLGVFARRRSLAA